MSDEPRPQQTPQPPTNSMDNWLSSSLLLNILTPENASRFQLNNLTTSEDLYKRFQVEENVQAQAQVERRTLCILRWPDGVSGFSTYEFM